MRCNFLPIQWTRIKIMKIPRGNYSAGQADTLADGNAGSLEGNVVKT